MKRFKQILLPIVFVALILINLSFHAIADPNIYYSVKPSRGDINTDFYVQVSISGKDFTNSTQPTFEKTEEMFLQYVSSSVQQQIINGDISFQKSFNYKIIFNKILPSGEHQLPRGGVFLDGKKFRLPTKNIFIEAGNSSTQPGNNTDPRASQQDDLNVPSTDGFKFVQGVSNNNPYIGEQVLYKVEIIAPDNLQKAELEEFEPHGVWRERYGQDEKKVRTTRNLSINSFSESWFPIQAGEMEVPTRVLHAEVREFQKKSRPTVGFGSNFSEQLLGSLLPFINQFRSVEKFIKAPGFKIAVKPLPPPPNGLSGFIPVGQIKVTSSLSSETAEIGEPVTLTIQVSGDANLRPLEIGDPEGLDKSELKRYDDKPILARTIGESNVTFYKTFKIALIPLKSGFVNIPSFKVQWFNPTTKEYEKYLTQSTALRVVGNDAGSSSEEATLKSTPKIGSDKIDNKTLLETEKPKESEIFNTNNVFRLGRLSSVYASLATISFILFQIVLATIKRKFSSKKYQEILNVKKLKSEIKLDLANSVEESQIIEKVKSLLSIKIDKDVSSLTSEEILDAARTKIPDPTLKELEILIEEMELMSFSGEKRDRSRMFEKINKVVDSI